MMSDFFARFSGGELIALVSVVGGLLIAVVSIVSHQWRRVRIAEYEASLKQQMLDKGMGADEIEQILKASTKITRH